ncbi:hypothetical protein COB52_04235 [Candidatus Kaiserbacteria bacterium]|nr:MAG: hypothetical protein COB52_04235 [Candidatus Kaiserbacteria bacterium]
MKTISKASLLLASLLAVVVLFQNCGKVEPFSLEKTIEDMESAAVVDPQIESHVSEQDMEAAAVAEPQIEPQLSPKKAQVKKEASKKSASILNKTSYGLISSITVEKKSGQRATNTKYRSYLTRKIKVKKGDYLILHGLVEGTHEPPPGDLSTSVFYSYLACNGARSSAYRMKTLKRAGGNHHGSFAVSGVCKVKKNHSLRVDLMARTSRVKGLVHFSKQTQLIINHYRPYLPSSSITNLAAAWWPKKTFRAKSSSSSFYFQNRSDPYRTKYRLLSAKLNVYKGDLIYAYAQGSAEKPNKEIPMFGFELRVDGKRHSVATENPTPKELFRLTQYGIGMWSAPRSGSTLIDSAVYGLESSAVVPRMLARRSYAALDGIIFSKGYGAKSFGLTGVTRAALSKNTKVHPDKKRVRVAPMQTIKFAKSGFLRAKSMATFKYLGADVRSCFIRMELKQGSRVLERSPVAGRYLKKPYTYSNLSVERIFQIKRPGSYRVESYVYCSGKRKNKTPVEIVAYGSGVVLTRFERLIE